MDRQRVSSSNISSIGYDINFNILEIEFHDGSIYQYHGVGKSAYNSLMSAASHGSYFSNFIKDRYSYRQIR